MKIENLRSDITLTNAYVSAMLRCEASRSLSAPAIETAFLSER